MPSQNDSCLLYSDIVDSTRLAREMGASAAKEAFKRHDELVRRLLVKYGAAELQRTDGFLIRLRAANDGIAFAADYHASLAAATPEFKVRIALHVGEVDVTERGDLIGLPLAFLSRLLSMASGGQTLLSNEARLALTCSAERVVSHGHWLMKGFEPTEVFEYVEIDTSVLVLREAAKAYRVVKHGLHWVPVASIPHSLPAERNAFVGRDDYLTELARLLKSTRLVSVFGAAGVGKTRFAQHYCWTTLAAHVGGIFYCDLSSATTREGVCSAVARGMNIQLATSDSVEQLANAIAERPSSLIVLDNFEQVIGHARATLGVWLDRAASVRFLVTTRTILGLDGERVFELPPMTVEDGVALFEQRAQGLRSRVAQVAVDDGRKVARLVDLLDGLPLAIEFAAARARVMSIGAIIDRMDERFKLLVGAESGRPSRQVTLRGAFDWSWELLSAPEHSALRQLATFAGGFRLEAAEAVIDLSSNPAAPEMLDILQALVDKSWITMTVHGRFGVLRSVDAYLAERRKEVPLQDNETIEIRHWRYFAALSDSEATADRCVELDNLIAATRRAIAHRASHDAAAALVKSWALMKIRGPYATAIDLADQVGTFEDLDDQDRARIELVGGSARRQAGAFDEATARFKAGLACARSARAAREEALLLCALGEHQIGRDRLAASADLEAAATLAKALDDEHIEAAVLNARGALCAAEGRYADAFDAYNRALTLASHLQDTRLEGGLIGNLGVVLYHLGRRTEAQEHYLRAVELAEKTGERRWEGNIRCNLGLLFHENGQSEQGREQLMAALTNARSMGRPRLEMVTQWNLGLVEESLSMSQSAIDRYRAALTLAERMADETSVRDLEQRIDVLTRGIKA